MDKYGIVKNYQAKAYVFSKFILKAEKEDLLNITESIEYKELIDAVSKLNDIGGTVKSLNTKEFLEKTLFGR